MDDTSISYSVCNLKSTWFKSLNLSWFGFGSRNQGENHNKQLFELHLWQQQIMQAVDSVPTLTAAASKVTQSTSAH